jgi:hypothetical protein
MSSEVHEVHGIARYSRDRERLHDLGKTSKTFTLIYTLPHQCPLMPLFAWRNWQTQRTWPRRRRCSLFFATYRTINEIRRLDGASRVSSLGRFWSANPPTVVTGQFVEMVKLTVILAWVSTASSP